jgi:hypothetical protein
LLTGALPSLGSHSVAGFDVLAFAGPVMDQAYRRRRQILEPLTLDGPTRCTTLILDGSVADVLTAVRRA